MALDFLGGIAGAYQAIQKGIDESKDRDYLTKRRQWQEEDRAAQIEDREYTRGQRQRTIEDQRRADRLRDADAAIPFEVDVTPSTGASSATAKPGGINQKLPATPTTAAPAATLMPMVDSAPTDVSSSTPLVDAQPTDAKTTTPTVGDQAQQPKTLPKRRITYGEYLRQLAKNRRDVGQAGPALELEQKASQWSLEQAGQRLNSLIGSSSSMSLEQFAGEAAKMFNEDPLPQSIRSIRPNADGSVTAVISMNDGRYSTEQTFKSKDDMTRALQSFYQPENFAKLQQAAAAAREKAREELMKPKTVKPGETIQVFNPETGKYQVIAEGRIPAGYEVVEGPNGETTLRRFDTGRGASASSSSGAGKGAKVDDPIKAAAEAVFEQATKGEIKLQPNQLSDAQLRAAQIASRGVPLYVAANVAIKVAQDPTLLKPRLDPRTGLIENVYEDSAVGQVVVDRDVASARNPKGMTKEQLQGFAKQVVTSVSNPEAQKNLVAAAFDPEARRKVEDQLTAEIGKQFDQMLQSNPNARASINSQRDATVKSSLEALGRKLDLINGHYPKPKDSSPPPKTDATRGSVGGINPSRFAGKSPREMDQMVAQEARDFRAQNKRTVLDSAAAARDPDIVRLTAEKEAALRAGKPVIANAKIEEIKKIQAERYMVQR